MAHMQPETWHGTMWLCEAHGETTLFPDDVFSKKQAADQCGVDEDDVLSETGWWARLSAPGYLDSTDWSGPFKTEKLALDYLYNLYDIDKRGENRAESGWTMTDDLDDEDKGGGPQGGTHGLGETPRRSNRRVHNLYHEHFGKKGRWVFRYGNTPYRFQDEELYFATRAEAVQIAAKHGWVVEDTNRVRQAHPGGISGV